VATSFIALIIRVNRAAVEYNELEHFQRRCLWESDTMITNPRARWLAAVVIPVLLLVGSALAPAEPTKAPADAEKDKAGWKALFDGKALGDWKSAKYVNSGKVEVKDGAIVLEKGNSMTGIVYGRGDFPKMNYEVTLEGKKLEGRDFFCTTTFPVGDSFCSLVVGGWGGTVVGLSSLNSMDASQNETTTSKEFKQDQWYRIRIRVTKDKIRAWIDEEKMVDVDTEDKKISIRVECAACKPFGIATWHTSGAVRDIRVRMLTDAEKKP
jgi:hypothetical protein